MHLVETHEQPGREAQADREHGRRAGRAEPTRRNQPDQQREGDQLDAEHDGERKAAAQRVVAPAPAEREAEQHHGRGVPERDRVDHGQGEVGRAVAAPVGHAEAAQRECRQHGPDHGHDQDRQPLRHERQRTDHCQCERRIGSLLDRRRDGAVQVIEDPLDALGVVRSVAVQDRATAVQQAADEIHPQRPVHCRADHHQAEHQQGQDGQAEPGPHPSGRGRQPAASVAQLLHAVCIGREGADLDPSHERCGQRVSQA